MLLQSIQESRGRNEQHRLRKIAAGLEDAIAFSSGDASRGRAAEPTDVGAVRKAMAKTREAFAAAYKLPLGTVRDWEQQRRQPDAPARALLTLIAADPFRVERLLAKAD